MMQRYLDKNTTLGNNSKSVNRYAESIDDSTQRVNIDFGTSNNGKYEQRIIIGIIHVEDLSEDIQELEVYDLTDGEVNNFDWINALIEADLIHEGEFDAVITAASTVSQLHSDIELETYIPLIQTTYELPTYHNIIDIVRNTIPDVQIKHCKCDVVGGRLIIDVSTD